MSALTSYILDQRQQAFELQSALTALRALGPENGGQGEWDKARFVQRYLAEAGIGEVHLVISPDKRVSSGGRPNIIAIMPGKSDKRLWLFGHLDVVPPGDPASWLSDPWQAVLREDYIYGRGVEDNQQAITSMLILASALRQTGMQPEMSLGLVFMADEECGSRHGLGYLLSACPGMFSPEDFYIVPDGGRPDASGIEIAEKAQLWLKFTIEGRQAHASLPGSGVNALSAAASLILEMEKLNDIFPQHNPLFEPPESTFVPTRHPCNVDAINVMSGKETLFMDCRILPGIAIQDVFAACQELAQKTACRRNVKIAVSIEHESPASETSPDAPVVAALGNAITNIYSVMPCLYGIGGATVAALLRKAGLPAVVWSCIENTCHQANERSSISATLKDAAVFGQIILKADG